MSMPPWNLRYGGIWAGMRSASEVRCWVCLQSDSSGKSADASAAGTASEASESGSDSDDSGQDDAGPPRQPLQARKNGSRGRHNRQWCRQKEAAAFQIH